ncbi:hypothetical protein Aduo_015289 [Ancylostoma duodenale]
MIKRNFEDASMKASTATQTRLRLLNQLNRLKETDPALLLDDFINECETFVTLRITEGFRAKRSMQPTKGNR